ncbi:MAG: hypothetical protein JXM74_04840 [Fusobacteriaceae bacterium]|nr:hypothetical protein [Fusobacteriaceae bacterium]
MVNFDLVIEMVNTICKGDVSNGMSFNEFCVKFYLETKILPLSKFLRLKGYSSKIPKIMNTRKAGEIIFESKNSNEILELLKKEGFSEIPQLNYSSIMILRKTSLDRNWIKLISYLKGEGTIEQIVRNNKKILLPEEKIKINEYLQSELNLNSTELSWLLNKFEKILSEKKILNSIKKLV